jgi:hypothetical protein
MIVSCVFFFLRNQEEPGAPTAIKLKKQRVQIIDKDEQTESRAEQGRGSKEDCGLCLTLRVLESDP